MTTVTNFVSGIVGDLSKNLKKAGFYGVSKMKAALNKAQPYKRTKGPKGVRYRGLQPSQAGDWPKKLTGQLTRSITFQSDDISMTIGTTLAQPPYPLFLAKGTSKMAKRPYPDLFWAQEKETLARIVLTGS